MMRLPTPPSFPVQFMLLVALLLGLLLAPFGLRGQSPAPLGPSAEYSNNRNTEQENLPEWMPGRLVLKLRPGIRVESEAELLALPGLQPYLDSLQHSRAYRKFPTAQPPEGDNPRLVDLSRHWELYYRADLPPVAAAQYLGRAKCLAYAEPHPIAYPLATPNDLDTVGQLGIVQSDFRRAWDIETGDTAVCVYITETSIQWDHPDLDGNLFYNHDDPIDGVDNDQDGYVDNYRGWDFVGADNTNFQPDNNPAPEGNPNVAFLEHGTWVAGFSSAQTNNDTGVAGAGFNCRFIPLKVSADEDTNGRALIYTGYEAIVYAADDPTVARGKKIINCSWGGSNFTRTGQDVVDYATFNQDAVVLAAAGNNPRQELTYPAAYGSVLSIGLHNFSDEFVGTYNTQVDLSVLGKGLTTQYPDTYGDIPGFFSSFSSPIAAGAAALVRSHFPGDGALRVQQRLRVTAEDISTVPANQTRATLIGKGRLDAERALFLSTPALRLDSLYLRNLPGRLPGQDDTLELTLLVRNWLQAANDARITLAFPDTTWATVVGNPLRRYFGIGSQAVKGAQIQPYQIRLKQGAPDNLTLQLFVQYQDGLYTDYEYAELLLNPTFRNLEPAELKTTLNSRGALAFNNFDLNTQGIGIQYQGRNHAYEAGFLLGGTNTNELRSTLRTPTGLADTGWASQGPVTLDVLAGSEEVRATFGDSHMSQNPLQVQVGLLAQAFTDSRQDDYLLLRYTLRNQNARRRLDSLFAGLMVDWDLGLNAANDSAAYVDSLRLAYAYGREGAGADVWMGVMLLSDQLNPHLRNTTVPVFSFSDSAKLAAIRGGTNTPNVQGGDVLQFLGAGPFSILPGDSQEVALALVGGASLVDLLNNAQLARSKYRCLMADSKLDVDLGPDTSACRSLVLDATTPGGQVYVWEPGGSQNPLLQVTRSGQYGVTVLDSLGCQSQDVIQVAISPGNTQADSLLAQLPDTAYVNNPFPLGVQGAAADSLYWLFGDGFGSVLPADTHFYGAVGTYTVALVLQEGACQDTGFHTVRVLPDTTSNQPTSRPQAPTTGLQLYPNPSQGRVTVAGLAPNVVELALRNSLGQLVLRRRHPGGQQALELSLEHLPAGVYSLMAVYANGSREQRRLLLR